MSIPEQAEGRIPGRPPQKMKPKPMQMEASPRPAAMRMIGKTTELDVFRQMMLFKTNADTFQGLPPKSMYCKYIRVQRVLENGNVEIIVGLIPTPRGVRCPLGDYRLLDVFGAMEKDEKANPVASDEVVRNARGEEVAGEE